MIRACMNCLYIKCSNTSCCSCHNLSNWRVKGMYPECETCKNLIDHCTLDHTCVKGVCGISGYEPREKESSRMSNLDELKQYYIDRDMFVKLFTRYPDLDEILWNN